MDDKLVTIEQIESIILLIRGQKVMLSHHLAESTKNRFKDRIVVLKQLAILKISMPYLNINFGRAFAGKIEEANYVTGEFAR